MMLYLFENRCSVGSPELVKRRLCGPGMYGPSIGFGVGPSMGYRSGFGGYGYGPSIGVRSSYYGGYGGGYRSGYGGYHPAYSVNRNSYPVYGQSYGYRRCR